MQYNTIHYITTYILQLTTYNLHPMHACSRPLVQAHGVSVDPGVREEDRLRSQLMAQVRKGEGGVGREL